MNDNEFSLKIKDFINENFYKEGVNISNLNSEELFELFTIDAMCVWKLPIDKINYDYLNMNAIGYYQDSKIFKFNLKKDREKEEFNHIYYKNSDFCFFMESFDKKKSIFDRDIEKTLELLLFLAQHYRSWLFYPQYLFKREIHSVANSFGVYADEIVNLADLIKL